MRHILGSEPSVSISLPVIDLRMPARLAPPLAFNQIREHAGAKQAWVWDGYLAAGGITMLTSLWKAGETTLVANLLRALCSGRAEFLGQRLGDRPRRLPALVITEEGPGLWAQRLGALGDGLGGLGGALPADSPLHFVSRPFLARPTPERWQQYALLAAEWAAGQGIGLVVIDPIANLIPGEENASGAMLDFLLPLAAFTRQAAAVLLLHHPRKSDGGEGRAARGSGALPGFVDIVLEMRRRDGDLHSRVRNLTALSRFTQTPAELCIELTATGDDYDVLHSCPDADLVDPGDPLGDLLGDLLGDGLSPMGRTIQGILAAAENALAAREIMAHWPAGSARPRLDSLQHLLKNGQDLHWKRIGQGTRRTPYRYHQIAPVVQDDRRPHAPREDSLHAEREVYDQEAINYGRPSDAAHGAD